MEQRYFHTISERNRKGFEVGTTEFNDIIYINVADLVDAYTGDGVTIEISNNNIVSIKNGAITKENLLEK